MKLSRRDFVAGATAGGAILSASSAAAQSEIVTPEHFGAKGDGRTNDTEAFARMSDYVNRRGGGEIRLRKTVYVVGRQARAPAPAEFAFAPATIMHFSGCARPLTIRGGGARLLCAPGLRYGTFDPRTGAPTHHPMPYIAPGAAASPYRAMIQVERCSAPVDISDLELDGNLANLRIGGQYGDTGWQLPATGIQLIDNSGAERLQRIRSHHHALDGLAINGLDGHAQRSSIEQMVCDHNGRQGCSITGGRGYAFSNCKFNHTGKGGLSSAPGAGVDVEAEGGKRVRDLAFSACEFSDNSGPGLVADNGDSEGAVFDNCRFIGTTNWAVWPNKPRFRFENCVFVGAIVHAFGDADPTRAAHFIACGFRDDPALSPTGEVYGGENSSRPIADLPANRNVLFDHCKFLLTHRSVLPWTTNAVIFADCVMSQRASAAAYPRGTFVGRNVIDGNVNLYAARIRGELIVNGKRFPRTG